MNEGVYQHIDLGNGKVISLETGRLAKQAGGAVVARLGETMVLCTAVVSDEVRPGQSFFPLTVDYRENYASGGKIPGGFIKREGRPTTKEVLSSRIVDRCIRPLFPDGFRNEVQVILSVISADGENDADVVAGVGASAALMQTGAPFDGPIGEVRVGRVDGEFVIYPTLSELEESDFNLVVAGKEDAIVMVEGEMEEVGEDDMIEALDFAHEAIKQICRAQHELLDKVGHPETREFELAVPDPELIDTIAGLVGDDLREHIRQPYEKATFYGGIGDLKQKAVDALLGIEGTEEYLEETPEGYTAGDIKKAVGEVERTLMREMIVQEHTRIDGRSLTDIRSIWSEVGYLPRAHGSAIFTRGETQALATVTLGGTRDVQGVDEVFDTTDKSFFLHYSFPPYSVGEARFLRGPGRREIGHGVLAERSLSKVIPDAENFPYTIRVTSDILESNGSSSMASVCAGSMALMNAGVPIKRAVSGIAMGLIEEAGQTVILSDILGTEDHLGDMDFKVTGTREGICACQMDIKISGLSKELMSRALNQAREGRHYILDRMEETITESNEELSPYAPRLTTLEIDSEFIGAVIGPGGKVIQGIQRETETSIDIEERDGKGYVTIASTNQDNMQAAVNQIRMIVTVPEVGENYEGTVVSIQPFGAIVEVLPGKEGLLHVSEINYSYVENVEDHFQLGDKVEVQVIEIKDGGRLRLSRKPLIEKPEGYEERPRGSRNGSRDGGGDRRGGGGRGRGRGGNDRRGGGGGGRGRGGNDRRGGGRDRR